MRQPWKEVLPVEWVPARERERMVSQLEATAAGRNWGVALVVAGWVHLGVFMLCHYLSSVWDYHHRAVFVALWVGELAAVAAVFRLCGGRRGAEPAVSALERVVRRIWGAYLILAINVTVLNGTAGHARFVLLPAIASLASFSFIMMTVLVTWRFFGPVLVMFASGLVMVHNPQYAYLVFGVAWWIVLERAGMVLWQKRRERRSVRRPPALVGAERELLSVPSA